MISRNSKIYSEKSDDRSKRFHRVVPSRPMLMGAPHNADKRSMREYHYQILTSSHMVSQTILSVKYFSLVNRFDVMAYLLKSSVTHFVNYFHKEEFRELSDAISKINDEPNQLEHKSFFWNLCVKFMIDVFLNDIKHLKEDIYELCNISDGYSGKSRLNSLDNRRKLFYFGLEFPIHPGTSIGEAENSKILTSSPVGSDEIIDCLFSDNVITAMYYEFYAVLEKNLPIRLCKNCNKPFVAQKRADSIYCDRVIPGSKDKCSVVGPLKTYRSKLPDIESDFYVARRRYNTRVSRNPFLKTEFEVWKIKSREKLIAYREGKLSADEFRKWFMDDEWMKLN